MNFSWRALIIDDDSLVKDSLKIMLPNSWTLYTGSKLSEIPNESFHAAFVDMHLTQNIDIAEGLEVIAFLRKRHPHLEIIAISGDLNRSLMEEALKKGATRFLAKPFSREEVSCILEKIEALYLLHDAVQRRNGNFKFVGKSESAINLKRQIAQLKGEVGPILIEGESGTGKEVIVQTIHSQENHRPFVFLNSSAVPENLFESEFFGHLKGAFTGADQNKMGLAEAAHDGDLFLDEIEALPLSSQAKLLRFLETGEIRKVGDRKTIYVKTRVIAATNIPLDKLVSSGKFREDLMWRLSGKKITVPPLRERHDDIPDLCNYFLEQQKPRHNKKFSEEALLVLKKHSWPGNIRELKRIVEQVCMTSPLPFIRDIDVLNLMTPVSSVFYEKDYNFGLGLDTLLKLSEKDILEKSIARYKDVDEVAEILGISRSGLYKKLKDYDINF